MRFALGESSSRLYKDEKTFSCERGIHTTIRRRSESTSEDRGNHYRMISRVTSCKVCGTVVKIEILRIEKK